MKPKDVIFILQEIDRSGRKLWTMELATLKSIRFKIVRDEDTTLNQDKLLLAIYQRITDAPKRYHGNIFKNLDVWLFLRLLKRKKIADSVKAQLAAMIQNEMHKVNGYKTVGKLDWITISNDIANEFIGRWTR